MTTNGHNNSEAKLLLEEAVMAINGAETLFFDARNLHTAGVVPQLYNEYHLPGPVTRQTYYSWNRGDTGCVRVQSACLVRGMNATTLFIKNRDGIWHVLPQCIVEVSTIFTQDQLLGTFPFFRFISALKYPYELSLDESEINIDRIVVKGHLAIKPPHCKEDIARDFSYSLGATNRQLFSLNETTFLGRSIHLEFDECSPGKPIDRRLFDVPDRRKVRMASMRQYIELVQQYYAKLTLTAT